MAKYTGNTLTNLGKDLLARAVIGGEALTFTKVELGKGVPNGDYEELTGLIEPFKVLAITSTAKLEGGSYRIRAAFSNSGITEDTYLREIGVFARGEDGVEILYSYCYTDTPDLIPTEGAGVLERVEDVITYISSATNVNAVIDQSKVYATIRDLTEGLAGKEDKFSKNTAFNKNYGTGEEEVPRGNHIHDFGAIIGCPIRVEQYFITEEMGNPAAIWPGTTWEKLEGRVLIGAGGSFQLKSEGGSASITLALANIPGHTHSFSATTSTTGAHSHTVNSHRHKIDNHSHTQPKHYHGVYGGGGSAQAIGTETNRFAGHTGNNTLYRTSPKGQIMESEGGQSTGSAAPYTDYQSPGTNSTGNHSHAVSGTTGNTGSGNSFNILNPYRAVNIWRRTA